MEYHSFERRVTPCAEFPNDNPDLHHGATWICVELGREPTCKLPLPRTLATADGIGSSMANAEPEPEPEAPVSLPSLPVSHVALADDLDDDLLDDDPEPIEIVDDLSFEDAADDDRTDAEAVECAAERAPEDPFARLVNAAQDVARTLGASHEDVACLHGLFGQSRLDGIAPGERAMEALVAGGVIAQGPRGLVRSSGFASKVLAWQGILRGESEDFSLSDGGALEPLDEWVADVLARVLGTPARADGIRRELRRRGIAAFGVVAEAA
jgi:hypothetical protein